MCWFPGMSHGREFAIDTEPSKRPSDVKHGERRSRFSPSLPLIGRRGCCRRLPHSPESRRRPDRLITVPSVADVLGGGTGETVSCGVSLDVDLDGPPDGGGRSLGHGYGLGSNWGGRAGRNGRGGPIDHSKQVVNTLETAQISQ